MNDLREELIKIIQPHDNEYAATIADAILAAGWTKPPVAQEVEPAAHDVELTVAHLKGLADLGRSTFSSAAMSFVLDRFFEAEGLLEDAERRIEVYRNTAKAWKQHANTARAAVSTQQPLSEPAPVVQEQELLADVRELAEYLVRCRRSYGYVVASVLPLDNLLERILTALRTQGGE